MIDESALREKFRRCSPETLSAMLEYRRSSDISLAPTIVAGVVQRYLPNLDPAALRDHDAIVTAAWDVDSLTMLEILLDLEDALDIDLSDADLRSLRTVGELQAVLAAKVQARPPA